MDIRSIQKIGILGVHKVDLVWYLASILQKENQKVLIYDYTRHQELKAGVGNYDGRLTLIRYRGVDLAFTDCNTWDEAYDYIIVVWDYGDCPVRDLDGVVLVSTSELTSIMAMQKDFQNLFSDFENGVIILRNVYSAKTVNVVQEYLPMDWTIYTLPHQCVDEKFSEIYSYQTYIGLPPLSKAFERLLICILTNLFLLTEQQAKRGVKAARGRRIL